MILFSEDELSEKFSFQTKVKPLPDAADFRVSLGEEDRQRIKRQIEADLQASLQLGTRDLWQRLYQVVRHMSNRMTDYLETEKGKGRKFYDAWVNNIVEIVDVLPKLNVSQDAELERMACDVRNALLVDPNELRKSESACTETARAASAIAARMAAYMGVELTAELGKKRT